MTDEEFTSLVLNDVNNNLNNDDKLYLRSPEVREKWRKYLLIFVESLSLRIDEMTKVVLEKRKFYEDFESDPAKQLNKSLQKACNLRFKFERRLAEAERLIGLRGNYDPDGKLFTFLRDAIIEHKAAKENPLNEDLKLWEVLDGVVN